jgi:LPS sulfotransferase NodH
MPNNTLSFEWHRLQARGRMLKKWWLKPHQAFQPFFVIATCRSGSNLLLSYLRQHELTMLSEVLCASTPAGPRSQSMTPDQAISHIRYSFQAEKGAIRGCKLMLYQLAGANLSLDRLDAEFPGAKYIVLYRQNLAEQYVSHLKSTATRQFVLRAGESKRDTQVHVDPAALREYCDKMRQGYQDVLSRPWLRERAALFSYEELVARPNGLLRNVICPLLGVSPVPAQTRLTKQNDQPLESCIRNFPEVAALLPQCLQSHHWPAPQNKQRRMAA